NAAFIAVTGNGLTIFEDLARRFLVSELDAHCEDPEQRRFKPGFLKGIQDKRSELLAAALTIWRWGRQNAADVVPRRPLGSLEEWAQWCRDPLLALGCSDPVQRIDRVKADDPHRRGMLDLFEAWDHHHGARAIKAIDLADPVRALVELVARMQDVNPEG